MSLFDYLESQALGSTDPQFASIMAAMCKADTDNLARLTQAFPEIWGEFKQRHNAPGGALDQCERDWLEEG